MPSQYGEHEVILNHFKGRIGKFLDIGAHNGKIFSNTYQLYEAGWSGVLVEPAPSVFPYLMQTYDGASRIELVNAALGSTSELQEWWDNNGDCLGTFSKVNKDKFSALGQPFKKMWLPMLTWEQLLAKLPGPYEFLNIDVEGLNWEVLSLAPLAKMGLEMVCVEIDPDHLRNSMKNVLSAAGFIHHQVVVGNLLAWR